VTKEEKALVPTNINAVMCHICGQPMKRVKWEITTAAYDARFEVEQTVYQCKGDEAFMSIEVSTGNPSKFALPEADEPDWSNPRF